MFGFGDMIEKLKKDPKTIVFTEGNDPRILEASSRLLASSFLHPILLGNPEEIEAVAEKEGFNIRGAEIIDPANYDRMDEMVEMFCELRKSKGVTPEEAKKILNQEHFKLISCHLGSGASICAIEDGKCVDTSMGFTPLAGVMMGTRSGDVDPSIIPYVMEKDGKNALEVINELNKDSGLLGLSEYSSDMRDILAKCDEEDERAILAKNKFVRRVVDYIGSYYLLLGGVDMIVFTAGVGENSGKTI